MKITLLTPALAAILGLALAGAPVIVHAQEAVTTGTTTASAPVTTTAPSTPPKATKPKPAATRYSGSITAIDADSLSIANTTKTLTLVITPKTVFKKDKIVATAADFAVGDKVSGSYTTDATGAMTAKSVYKKTAAAKAPAPAATTTETPSAAPAAPATPVTQ